MRLSPLFSLAADPLRQAGNRSHADFVMQSRQLVAVPVQHTRHGTRTVNSLAETIIEEERIASTKIHLLCALNQRSFGHHLLLSRVLYHRLVTCIQTADQPNTARLWGGNVCVLPGTNTVAPSPGPMSVSAMIIDMYLRVQRQPQAAPA